jgi:ABC-type lipoprotein release transport system permease subunit
VTFEQLEDFVKAAPPGIEHADFYWNSQGLLVGREAGRGVLIEGTRRSKNFPGSTKARVDLEDNEVRLSLGTPLAKILGVERGDRVRLLLPGVLKGSVVARVERLVSHGIFELDSRFAVVDDESLRNYLKKNDIFE